jgi:hypothetical protein
MPPTDHALYDMLADIRERLARIEERQDASEEAGHRREVKIDAVNQHVTGLLDLPQRVADVEAGVKDYRELKQRGYGALAMAGLIGGGAATGIIAFFQNWFGGSGS